MLAQDGERVSIAARVRRRRPGADDARVVPDDIGEYERLEGCVTCLSVLVPGAGTT